MVDEPNPDPSTGTTPKIHRATTTQGKQGAVIKGDEITEAEAIAERRLGRDIVVCGDDLNANRIFARQIEDAIGPNFAEPPHESAGPYALSHLHQLGREPAGHCFYETGKRRKARKKP